MVFGLFVVQKMPSNVFDFLWKTNLFVNIDAQEQKQINMFFTIKRAKTKESGFPRRIPNLVDDAFS